VLRVNCKSVKHLITNVLFKLTGHNVELVNHHPYTDVKLSPLFINKEFCEEDFV